MSISPVFRWEARGGQRSGHGSTTEGNLLGKSDHFSTQITGARCRYSAISRIRSEDESIAERIEDLHIAAAPRGRAYLRKITGIGTVFQFAVKSVHIRQWDAQSRSRAGISMMFGKVQDAGTPGNLQIQWQVRFKPVLPVDLEFQPLYIEGPGFCFVEDPEYGYGRLHAV